MTSEQIYDTGFIDLGRQYARMFMENKFTMQMVADCKSIRYCLYETYAVMLKHKWFDRIEKLPTVEKETLWDLCKPFCSELSKPSRIIFSKCYYAMHALIHDINEK